MIEEKIKQANIYKRKVAGSYIPINGADINSKVSGKTIYISKKIDGEFNLLWFDGNQCVLINSNGTVKENLPVLLHLGGALHNKGLKSLTMAVELHLKESEARSRIFEVMSAMANNTELLTLTCFDLLDIDGKKYQEADYAVCINEMNSILEGSDVNAVSLKKVSSSKEVSEYFTEMVVDKGAEGLVVRSLDFPMIYKIKPVHSIDAVVIGFTEGEAGKVRDILLALMHDNGTYVRIGKTGNGFTEDEKEMLFAKLTKEVVPSTYIEADGRRVAFQMVTPHMVVEVDVNELLTENMKGVIKNPLISFSDKEGYSFDSNILGVSLIHPIFKRIRDDKKVNNHDIRFSQITDIVYLSDTKESTEEILPKSEIIFKEVYTKISKKKTNVQKFVIWKTNKEKLDSRFPAYVLHYTNFSPTRKAPLKKDVKVSSSLEQLLQMKDALVKKNIKKGWKLVAKK